MCQKDSLLKIMHLVHELDEISKEVFFLRITGDLSLRDIGEIMEWLETFRVGDRVKRRDEQPAGTNSVYERIARRRYIDRTC